jgi:hypothetical protein
MQQLDLERFHSACTDVILGAKASKALNYAVGYARAGMNLSDAESIRVQCLYILNNITHWRGDTAKRARAVFKEFAA